MPKLTAIHVFRAVYNSAYSSLLIKLRHSLARILKCRVVRGSIFIDPTQCYNPSDPTRPNTQTTAT